jgi:hypothetical protein
MFREPRAVAERGFALVAGLGVDAIERDHAAKLSERGIGCKTGANLR